MNLQGDNTKPTQILWIFRVTIPNLHSSHESSGWQYQTYTVLMNLQGDNTKLTQFLKVFRATIPNLHSSYKSSRRQHQTYTVLINLHGDNTKLTQFLSIFRATTPNLHSSSRKSTLPEYKSLSPPRWQWSHSSHTPPPPQSSVPGHSTTMSSTMKLKTMQT